MSKSFALLYVVLCGVLLSKAAVASGAFCPVPSHRIIQPVTPTLANREIHDVFSADTSKQMSALGQRSSVVVRSSAVVGGVAAVGSVIPSGSLASINSFFKYYPLIASFLICAFKASSADIFAQLMSFKTSVAPRQSRVRRSMPFSIKRNLALLCYGGIYQGCAQQLIYNNLFLALFGAGTDYRTVLMKVSFDMLLIQPILSLPIAYLIKAPIFGHSVSDSIRKYLEDVRKKKLLQTCWMVWTPTQIVSFTVVPPHLRISFMACVSFFWIILFSTLTSSASNNGNSIAGSDRI
mmetsp:Transcript_26754/g.62852  ORF Transcript_26754/g.62852 Transcript_26754/m.62852 type:complete len:293 (+) Transcript_26754:245-1123(+)